MRLLEDHSPPSNVTNGHPKLRCSKCKSDNYKFPFHNSEKKRSADEISGVLPSHTRSTALYSLAVALIGDKKYVWRVLESAVT